MPVILGESGVNKELSSIYLGNSGVNKQGKELYLGKSGVNKQIYVNKKEIIVASEIKFSTTPPESSTHVINLEGVKFIRTGGMGASERPNGYYRGQGNITFYDSTGNYIRYSQHTLADEYEDNSSSIISYNGANSINLGNRYYTIEIDFPNKVVRVMNYNYVDSVYSIASWGLTSFNMSNMIRTMTIRTFDFYETIIRNYA